MRLIKNDQSGFTLVETLIALTIFAVGLLGIAGMQARSISYNAGSNTRTVATALAQGAMEALMARPTNDAMFRSNAVNQVFKLDPADAAKIDIPGAGSYTINWDVAVDTPTTRMSRVTVRVAGPSGRQESVTNTIRYSTN